jgi:hypothetical protein
MIFAIQHYFTSKIGQHPFIITLAQDEMLNAVRRTVRSTPGAEDALP